MSLSSTWTGSAQLKKKMSWKSSKTPKNSDLRMIKEKPKLPEQVPQHIAIIMDGNGRWAKQRGLPRLAGHRAGTDNLRRIIEAFLEFCVKVLTLYPFSTQHRA